MLDGVGRYTVRRPVVWTTSTRWSGAEPRTEQLSSAKRTPLANLRQGGRIRVHQNLALAGIAGKPGVSDAQACRGSGDAPVETTKGTSFARGDPILVMARRQQPLGCVPRRVASLHQTGALASHEGPMFPSCHPRKGNRIRSNQYGVVLTKRLEPKSNPALYLRYEVMCLLRRHALGSRPAAGDALSGSSLSVCGRWEMLGLRALPAWLAICQ